MFRLSVVVSVFLSVGSAVAQRAPLAGPIEGYVFDAPTRGFRAISGALGSASLGPILVGGFEFGSVAPGKNYAIAYRAGQCLLITGLDSTQPASAMVSDSCTLPEGAVWSGDGTGTVLYSRTGNWFQSVTGLPAQAVANPAASVASLGGSLSAVSPDFSAANIFVALTGTSAGVYQVQSDQSLAPLLPLAQPIALAVSDERQSLYALDATGGIIYEMSLADSSFQSWALNGLQDPVALRPARDGAQRQVLYVAGRGDQLLVAYDALSHAGVGTVPLDFAPLGLDRLGADTFVLRNRTSDSDPLWAFTDTSEPPAVYFVPSTPLAVSGGLQ